jgi:hypothetical protein
MDDIALVIPQPMSLSLLYKSALSTIVLNVGYTAGNATQNQS